MKKIKNIYLWILLFPLLPLLLILAIILIIVVIKQTGIYEYIEAVDSGNAFDDNFKKNFLNAYSKYDPILYFLGTISWFYIIKYFIL